MSHENGERRRRNRYPPRVTRVRNLGSSERWLSTMVGALVGIYSFSRLSFWSLSLIFGSAYLLYRGLSGHCYGYEALGIDRSGVEAFLTELEPFSNMPPEDVQEGDIVAEASWESFPTSDPPSWTMGRSEEA